MSYFRGLAGYGVKFSSSHCRLRNATSFAVGARALLSLCSVRLCLPRQRRSVLSFAGFVAFFIWTKSSLFFKLDLGLTLSSELGFTTPGSLCFLYLTGFSVSCLLVFWYLVFPSHP